MRLRFGSRSLPRFLLTGVSLLVAACVTKPVRVYEDESFMRDTPYEYYSSRVPEGDCEIGKRALLSQGYQVDDGKALTIKGEKYFKPVSDQANKLTITLTQDAPTKEHVDAGVLPETWLATMPHTGMGLLLPLLMLVSISGLVTAIILLRKKEEQ